MGSSKHRALYDCTGHTPMNLSWLPPISSVDSYSSENGRPVFLKHFSWSPVCSSILIAQYTSFSSESETVTQLCLTLVTPWTIDLACQALLSIEFSRQEFWSGLPRPSPGDFPNPGSPGLLHCRQILYCLSYQWNSLFPRLRIREMFSNPFRPPARWARCWFFYQVYRDETAQQPLPS